MIELRLALTDDQVAALAEQVAVRLADSGEPLASDRPEDGWLDTRRAADYLGLSVHALHKLTAARAVPFEQEGPGCRCWFKRSDLDAWVRAGRLLGRAARVA
jgi:hypothetical protein